MPTALDEIPETDETDEVARVKEVTESVAMARAASILVVGSAWLETAF